MEWIKIPIDEILFSDLKNSESFALIKYQALYCHLEKEPTLNQLKRIMNKRELAFVQSSSEVCLDLVSNQIKKVKQKRHNDKLNYKQKQCDNEKPDSENNTVHELFDAKGKDREGKDREERKNICKKENNIEADFSEFWECYTPIRVKGKFISKGTKKTVFAVYERARKIATHQEIMGGLKKYMLHCKNKQQITCGAAVFLNPKKPRWLDDYDCFVEADKPPAKMTDAEKWENTAKHNYEQAQRFMGISE